MYSLKYSKSGIKLIHTWTDPDNPKEVVVQQMATFNDAVLAIVACETFNKLKL